MSQSNTDPSGADTPILLRRQQGAVLSLTLNRPRAGNALSSALIEALQNEFDRLMDDRSVHAVVIDAAGKLFCTGHDLKEVQDANDPQFLRALGQRCSVMMQAIAALPQPVIAKVRGIATAAGCQLAAACDLVVAGRSAQFATPGVNIGLWCLTPMVALSRTIAPKHAMQMLLSGKLFGAEEAFRFGLVSQIVEDGQLDEAVATLAGEIAAKSSFTMALGKQAFYGQLELTIAQAYDYACELLPANMAHPDAKEGIQAFIDKRPARWKGR